MTTRTRKEISLEALEQETILAVPYVMRFASEQRLAAYRKMLYDVNKQRRGEWAYVTKRIAGLRLRIVRMPEDY